MKSFILLVNLFALIFYFGLTNQSLLADEKNPEVAQDIGLLDIRNLPKEVQTKGPKGLCFSTINFRKIRPEICVSYTADGILFKELGCDLHQESEANMKDGAGYTNNFAYLNAVNERLSIFYLTINHYMIYESCEKYRATKRLSKNHILFEPS